MSSSTSSSFPFPLVLFLLWTVLLTSSIAATSESASTSNSQNRQKQKKQEFNAALDAADRFAQQGDLQQALAAFETAHQLKPRDVYSMQVRERE